MMIFSKDNGFLYDVVAVDMDSNKVSLMATGKNLPDAEAIAVMAVMRRGVETHFYAEVPANSFKDGDEWKRPEMPAKEPDVSEDGRLYRVGNTWYPNGPRGLDR